MTIVIDRCYKMCKIYNSKKKLNSLYVHNQHNELLAKMYYNMILKKSKKTVLVL